MVSYQITGTAPSLSLGQGITSSLTLPSDEWPLTDGNIYAHPGATTATDTTGGNTAGLTGSATWPGDDYFQTDIGVDGHTGYLTPPAATIPATDATPSVSVWFKTTTADGILISLQSQAFTPGSTTTSGYNPVMYVGTDGKLYAEWWTGHLGPILSTATVDDGLWHHAVLTATTANGGSQTLYLDGQAQGTITGTVNLTQTTPTNAIFGAGYTGGSWPAEPHYKQSGSTGYPDYFNGQIADVTFTR